MKAFLEMGFVIDLALLCGDIKKIFGNSLITGDSSGFRQVAASRTERPTDRRTRSSVWGGRGYVLPCNRVIVRAPIVYNYIARPRNTNSHRWNRLSAEAVRLTGMRIQIDFPGCRIGAIGCFVWLAIASLKVRRAEVACVVLYFSAAMSLF